MTTVRALLTRLWARFLPRARITARIIAAVVVAMTMVLVAAGAFVYWRISFALDRQLNQDLSAYTDTIIRTVQGGGQLPADDPGDVAQTFGVDGTLLSQSDRSVRRLLAVDQARDATTTSRVVDLGAFLPPPDQTPYRIRFQRVQTPTGPIVLATATSRHKHDEALRELLLQLGIADLATILAAAVVGWGATRAALVPVESYRKAAAGAEGSPSVRLPVDETRDDELTRLGKTFNGLLAELEDSRRRERQFLADASHELRSPLALLAAEVEWAQHRPRTAEEIKVVLRSVSDQTHRLVELANALLDLEEASERGNTRLESVSLHQLVGDAALPYARTADQHDRRIEVDAEDTTVAVDRRWVELALGNLIGNALKHGEGTVHIAAGVTEGQVRLDVTDDGGGIPAELGTIAFERFSRAERARTNPGNGLGLAIVDAVARRHGGTATLIDGGVRIQLVRRMAAPGPTDSTSSTPP